MPRGPRGEGRLGPGQGQRPSVTHPLLRHMLGARLCLLFYLPFQQREGNTQLDLI